MRGFRLNLLWTITMTREAVPVMMEKGWGRIINMTSISVKQPIDGLIISNTIRVRRGRARKDPLQRRLPPSTLR